MPRSFWLTPPRQFDRLKLDARRVGEAKECVGPSRDRVLLNDTFADQERQGVAAFEDELPLHRLGPPGEVERHEQAGFGPGDWQQRQLTAVAL